MFLAEWLPRRLDRLKSADGEEPGERLHSNDGRPGTSALVDRVGQSGGFPAVPHGTGPGHWQIPTLPFLFPTRRDVVAGGGVAAARGVRSVHAVHFEEARVRR